MSKKPTVVWAWDLPKEHGDLLVKCNGAAWARIKDDATESEGINFNGATVQTGKSSGGELVASGNLYCKWPGNEDSLTNPFRLAQNDKGYWKAYPIDGQPALAVAAPPAPKENTWAGGKGGGKGGGSKTMTKEQLDQAIAYAINATGEAATDLGLENDSEPVAEVFAKILGCAMFVEWGSAPADEAPPVNDTPPAPADDDIPF